MCGIHIWMMNEWVCHIFEWLWMHESSSIQMCMQRSNECVQCRALLWICRALMPSHIRMNVSTYVMAYTFEWMSRVTYECVISHIPALRCLWQLFGPALYTPRTCMMANKSEWMSRVTYECIMSYIPALRCLWQLAAPMSHTLPTYLLFVLCFLLFGVSYVMFTHRTGLWHGIDLYGYMN